MPQFDGSSDGQFNPNPGSLPVPPETLAQLEQIAQARNLDPASTVRQLVESEIRRLGVAEPSCLSLTPKQQLVIQKLRSGLSVKEVAASMNVSEQTVRTHILRARTRLGQADLLSLRYL